MKQIFIGLSIIGALAVLVFSVGCATTPQEIKQQSYNPPVFPGENSPKPLSHTAEQARSSVSFPRLPVRPGPSLMNIQEQNCQLMLSEQLSDAEKLDSLHSLIPADSCRIDNLSQATREQLRQLRDGIAVTQAMQELRRKV